jgi:hypothetical protein
MENKNHTIEPENKKSSKDFIKLLIGVFVVIISLVILKYLASAFGIM